MKIAAFIFPEAQNPADDKRLIRETLQDVKLAEDLGLDAIFLAEHHFDGNCVYVDPPTFAAALATATTKIKIGFAVLQTSLYHPLRLAEQLSLLDHLSQGRLIVGLGRGSLFNSYEYSGYEINPDDAQARFEEIEEILIQCWTQEKVQHKGKFWNFEIPMLRPRPFTKPFPQLLRSVTSEGSTEAQARRGRPVLLASPTDQSTTRLLTHFRNSMSAAGHNNEKIAQTVDDSWVTRTVIVADTDAEADRAVTYVDQMQAYRSTLSPAFSERIANPTKSVVPPAVYAGSPATVIEKLKGVPGTGIGGLIVRFRVGPMPAEFARKSMTLFMQKVLPQLASN